jgi:hypothetical protein
MFSAFFSVSLKRRPQVPEHDPRSPSRVCDSCYANINKSQLDAASAALPAPSAKPFTGTASPSAPAHGLSMADFEVIKHLGKGAFGQVLEVCDGDFRERVARGSLSSVIAGCGEKNPKALRFEGDVAL